MAKRLDKSSKGKGVRTATAKTAKAKTAAAKARTTKTTKALCPSEVIMTMTNEDAERYRTIFRSAWSR